MITHAEELQMLKAECFNEVWRLVHYFCRARGAKLALASIGICSFVIGSVRAHASKT